MEDLELAKILVVEDDASLRVVIRLVLEQAGYDMTEAPNGQVALDMLNGDPPDLILVDSKMPILGGAQVIEHVRAEPAYASIPIVLLTGFSDTHAGADAVVAKPFERTQLLDVIERLVRRTPASSAS